MNIRAASGSVLIANYPQEAAGPQPEPRLTRKEAALLELLRRNAGRCLSREYLLATVWGYRDGTRTRTLDVHIQRLRRKLGADRIVTVLRAGYLWIDK